MSARDTHLLSGAYVLHAVTAEEARAVEAAMTESEEFREEVVGLADTAVALGLAVAPTSPPSALRASLLAAIDGVPQVDVAAVAAPVSPEDRQRAEQPRRDVEAAADAEDRSAVSHAATGSSTVAHLAPHRRRRRPPRAAVLLAAGALAVALFGGGVLVQRAVTEPQLAYSRVVAAADAQTVREAVRGGGTIAVTTSRSERAAAVSLRGVQAPIGKALQVWVLHDGSADSAGLYTVGAEGQVLERLPATGDRVAVTIEPAGGSSRPTATPIAIVAPA